MPKLKFLRGSTEFNFEGKVDLVDLDEHIMFGCKSGNCGTCAVQIVEGAHNLSLKTDREHRLFELIEMKEPSMRLACQCSAHGDVVFLEVN